MAQEQERICKLEDMTEKEFMSFRQKYLSLNEDGSGRLTSEAMTKIRRAFELNDYDTQHIVCDKEHAHNLNCVVYDSRTSCVVERLIEEIREYRTYLNRISGEMSVRSG
jgi:hypothetical protein